MKRVVIAEDEKLIRQGLRVMIERCDVPVEEIIETRNGQEALTQILSQPVDVLFTDIRMLQMDGLTLLRQISETTLPWPKPEIVVISGYEDFNYAVEAMRYGAREYILKPIRRERIFETLKKIEGIIHKRESTVQQRLHLEKLGQHYLKYALTNPDISKQELETIQHALKDLFPFGSYIVLCSNQHLSLPETAPIFQIQRKEVFYLYLVSASFYEEFIRQYLPDGYVGASGIYEQMEVLSVAIDQAIWSRKQSFYTGSHWVSYTEDTHPNKVFTLPVAPEKLAPLIGSKEYGQLPRVLHQLYQMATCEHFPPALFEDFMTTFLKSIAFLFKQHTFQDGALFATFKNIYSYHTIQSYYDHLLCWLEALHSRVCLDIELTTGKDRIQKAMAYIDEHYNKNLNMATVSNHISMNYSLFSKLFKQYTEKSFVEYLRALRIEKSKEYLVETDLKIIEIGRLVGFEDDKYFIKSFKAIMGVSPSQYRRINQEKEEL